MIKVLSITLGSTHRYWFFIFLPISDATSVVVLPARISIIPNGLLILAITHPINNPQGALEVKYISIFNASEGLNWIGPKEVELKISPRKT